MRWQELALRSTLIVGLLLAITFSVTLWIATPLGLMAIAATTELAVRPYAASAVDRLLLGCGALVTTLILTGLALNLTPQGLTRTTWCIAWTVLSIGVLAWRRGLGSSIGWPSAGVRSFSLWIFSASLIFVAAATLALVGVQHWNRRPVLAFALESKGADTVTVEIDATSVTEQYRIVAIPRIPGAWRYYSPPLSIRSGQDGIRVLKRVPINAVGVWVINLESIDNGTVVRRLIIDFRRR
jgi:hypothetical protein